MPTSFARTPEPVRVAFVMHMMGVAGAEVLVAETIRRLGRRLEPLICCLDGIGPLGEQLRSDGVPVVVIGRRLGKDWRTPVRLAQEFRRHGAEVIHAHQYTPFFYSALARVLCGNRPRLIFTEHGRHYPDIVSSARRRVNQAVLAHLAAEVNAVCEFSAEALRRTDGFGQVPVQVIENGIDVERYGRSADRAAAKRRVGLAPERRHIINVARFHPVKDQMTLITAFAQLAGAANDVDLVLVGDGALRAELERAVAVHGLGERVHLLGIRRDIAQLLDAADVFCLSSVSEAASLTLLEAMASALPVVVSAVGGNPEIVADGRDGLLFPRGDVEQLAQALLRVLADPALAARLGAAAAARVHATYRLERTIDRYFELYARLATHSADKAAALLPS